MSKLDLNEIMNLDSSKSSIKKIDLFLEDKIKNSYEYIKALSIKAIITYNLGEVGEALKLLFNYVSEFKTLEDSSVITICDAIILICLKIKRYDQVEKYIEIKKEYLPISRSDLYLKDKISLYLAQDQKDLAMDVLKRYLQDNLVKEEAIWAKRELSNIYFLKHDFDSFLILANELKDYYTETLNKNKYEEIVIRIFKSYIEINDYIRVINEYNNYDIKSFNDDNKLYMASFIIESFMNSNDYKKASIIESNYIDYINDSYIDASISFILAATKIYEFTNSISIINDYNEKLKHFYQLKEPIKKEDAKRKKEEEKLSDIKVPIIRKKNTLTNENSIIESRSVIINKPQNELVNVVKNYKNIYVSPIYKKISLCMEEINKIDSSLKFREVLRLSLIYISKIFPIEEAYLLVLNHKYYGFHYKKERLYDKKLEYDDLTNTCNLYSLEKNKECFRDSTDMTYNRDIITKEEYMDDTFVYSFPLNNSLETYASLSFISKNDFMNEDMAYEGIKILINLINKSLLYSIDKDDFELSNKKLLFLYQNNKDGIKEMHDNQIHLSKRACEILGLLPDITLDDFYMNMSSIDVMEYKQALAKIYNLGLNDVKVEYKYRTKDKEIDVKEEMHHLEIDGVIYIMSMVSDVSRVQNMIGEAMNLAYTNPLTHLNTEIRLLKDLDQAYRDNQGFYLYAMSIYDIKFFEDLYGFNFKQQIIYNAAQYLSDILEVEFNSSLYYCFNEEYVIMIKELNDKRLALSKIKGFIEKLRNKFNQKSIRAKVYFDVGIYKHQAGAKLNNTYDFITRVNEALSDSRTIKSREDHISFYNGDKNKELFREKQLVVDISEAMDMGRIATYYQQIVDIVESSVYGYYVTFNLESRETTYENMMIVAKRKGIIQELEKHIVYQLFHELKVLWDQNKCKINVFINISDDTIDNKFYEFIKTQQHFFRIDPKNISLIVSSGNNVVFRALREEGYKICTKDIMDIYRNNCDYFLYDYHLVTDESINEVKNLCKVHHVRMILNGVMKADMPMIRENKYDLFIGDEVYKKKVRISDIILKLKR